MGKARAVEELKINGSCHPHPPLPTKASLGVSQPELHQEPVTPRSQTHYAKDRPIDYLLKIPVPPSQANPSTSNKHPHASVRSTRAEMPTDLCFLRMLRM